MTASTLASRPLRQLPSMRALRYAVATCADRFFERGFLIVNENMPIRTVNEKIGACSHDKRRSTV